MFNVAVYQFTYSFPLLSTKFCKIKRRFNSFNYLFFLSYVLHLMVFLCRGLLHVCGTGFRCGSLLIYVVVDNQTEKLKITSTTHLNRAIDIYAEECKLKKYLLNVGHLSRPQYVDFCMGRVCYKNPFTNLPSPLAMMCQFEEQSHNSSI